MNKTYAEFVASRISPNVIYPEEVRLVHIVLGLISEVGEFADPFKKAATKAIPARDLDFTNLDEEVGDILFYLQEYANYRERTLESFCAQNQAKLTARYPQGFTAERSDNRNLEAEREALEANQAMIDGENT